MVRFKEAFAAPPYLCIAMEYVSGACSFSWQVPHVCTHSRADQRLLGRNDSELARVPCTPYTCLSSLHPPPGGDLLDYINAQRSGVAEDEARYIFQQLVRPG